MDDATRYHDWWPEGETVLGIWAHPDDEAYLSAGLMARTVRSGGRVVCRHATRGERGTPDPEGWPPERLAPLRERELAASLAVLGVVEHAFLGYADGDCDRVPMAEVVPVLAELIRELRPDLVVTFGPDGITGHPDHQAVSRWATAAWREAGYGWLRYAASTESFVRRFHGVHERLGIPPGLPSVPDEQVALAVRLTEAERRVKRAALAGHASQTEPLAAAMGERTYRRWYGVETFRAPTAEELAAAAAVAAEAGS
jgi:LmbE family N-acetylglucosaminyl deacetylase